MPGSSAPFSAAIGGLGTLSLPIALPIDGRDNRWAANTGDDSISKFVASPPVLTPLAH